MRPGWILYMSWLFRMALARRHLHLPVYTTLRIYVGNLKYLYIGRLNYELADAVFIGHNCGVRAENCPLYCNDSQFTAVYCLPTCQPTTAHTKILVCGNEQKTLDLWDSPTAKPQNLTWWGQTTGNRRLSGERWTENINFTALRNYLSTTLHHMKDMRIVLGTSLDQRLMRGRSVLFGLAPGPNSLANQFCDRFGLYRNIATISLPVTLLRYRLPAIHYMKFGDLDGSRCRKWVFVDSLSKDKWVFPIGEVDFMGVRLKSDQAMGIFYHDDTKVIIGKPIADSLIALGAFEVYEESELYVTYKRPCRVNPKTKVLENFLISINVGDHQIKIGPRGALKTFIDSKGSTVRPIPGKVPTYPEGEYECLLNIVTEKRNPHAAKNVWTLGRDFLYDHCVALDYDRNRIGFGQVRKPPFPL